MSAAPSHSYAPERRQRFWREYLAERNGTFEWRCRRYAEVADELESLGLANNDTIIDVGAGYCEFDRYLRGVRGWHGIYVPVDGAINGVELDAWIPDFRPNFFVCIEVIEHLDNPYRMLTHFERFAENGAVVTTPNCNEVDVIALDRTHVSFVPPQWFVEHHGWSVRGKELFNHGENDTLIATYAQELPF